MDTIFNAVNESWYILSRWTRMEYWKTLTLTLCENPLSEVEDAFKKLKSMIELQHGKEISSTEKQFVFEKEMNLDKVLMREVLEHEQMTYWSRTSKQEKIKELWNMSINEFRENISLEKYKELFPWSWDGSYFFTTGGVERFIKTKWLLTQ